MTTPIIPRIPNSELVTAAWIRDAVTVYDVGVGTTLQGPDRDTGVLSWGDSGFVVVSVVGGNRHSHVPLRQPVMDIACWSARVGGKAPPWGRAASLAELIMEATQEYQVGDAQGPITLPSDYGLARVTGAVPRTEVRRRPSDVANYAQYGFELEISWLAL